MEIQVNTVIADDSWSQANRTALWGWKRDSGPLQRIILFGATIIAPASNTIRLDDWFIYYRTRGHAEDISEVWRFLSTENVAKQVGNPSMRVCPRTKLSVVELCGGSGLVKYKPLLQRLLNRRPRRRVPTGSFPTPTTSPLKISALGPVAAYVGSGLSYESGLPTLASVHETFGVDRLGDNEFTFGARDPFPRLLAESVGSTLALFTQFHLMAALAPPSTSHERLADLHRAGIITRILTDNVDNLFSKVDVPFTRTRGIGIFNDRFDIDFDQEERTLLVIGVAADRRSIISQARRQGLRIVVVNPQEPVSPKSQSLSYLRLRDSWYKMTAKDFFEHIVYD
jgi:hypothetical protein